MTPRAPAHDDRDRLTPASATDVRAALPARTILSLRVHLRVAICRNLLMREGRRSIERWGLTLPQFDALAELARSGRGGYTFGELSRLLLVTSGNLTGIVDRLESEGLVRRQQGTRDRRVVRIVMTRILVSPLPTPQLPIQSAIRNPQCDYSYLSASIGSRREARIAGSRPAINPTSMRMPEQIRSSSPDTIR